MQTNFFSMLSQMATGCNLRMIIQKAEGDKVVIVVMPFNDQITDKALQAIEPIRLRGTIQEFDESFFTFIKEPLEAANGLIINMESFQASVEQAKKQSQMEKGKQDKEEKEKKERKTEYDKKMQKVADLEKSEKWGEAIGQMPDAKNFPEYATEIDTKLKELKGKYQVRELF